MLFNLQGTSYTNSCHVFPPYYVIIYINIPSLSIVSVE